MDFINYFVPVFFISILIESIYLYKTGPELFKIKDSFTSIAMGLGTVLIDTVFTKVIVLAIYTFVYQYSFFKIESSILAWIAILFLEDFCYYWFHRVSHESRFFWASHVVHHSSESYNLSTAVRQTWSGTIINTVFWIPLLLIGFSPVMVMIQQSVSLIYQFFIHTETVKTLGILETVMNTPAHHRVHHGSDLKYLDRNYAGIFIIWDRLFKTFQQEEEIPKYGLVKNIHTHNPFIVAFKEWSNILKDCFKAKKLFHLFGYIFAAPGWSPEGGTTTAELRKSTRKV